jgi:hypothetical protein
MSDRIRAIAASRHRSGGLRPEPAAQSQPYGRSSHIALSPASPTREAGATSLPTIAGALPPRLTLIICAVICIAADIAIRRI